MEVIFVPACCTSKLQPLDVSGNCYFKEQVKSRFTLWYGDEVAGHIQVEGSSSNSRLHLKSPSNDSHSHQNDEAFGSRENSQNEFHNERIGTIYKRQFSKDSEEFCTIDLKIIKYLAILKDLISKHFKENLNNLMLIFRSSGIQDDSEMESTETSGPSSSKLHVQLSSGSISSLSSVSPTSLPYSDSAHYEANNESYKLSTVSSTRSSWHHEISQSAEKIRHVDSSVNGKHKWNYRELVKPSFTLHEEDSKTNMTIKRSRSAKASLQELNCDITEENNKVKLPSDKVFVLAYYMCQMVFLKLQILHVGLYL
ncbi:hypothetical protein GQR58_004058 [Nymphon striatum]|nr:hypothetical protein GQR58_004058 [Nymphon striatum]